MPDQKVCETLHAGHHLISQVIDTDQEEGMMVAWGISEQLDQLKLTYHGLPDFLTALVEAELERIPRHLSDAQRRQLWSIVYMPQVLPRSPNLSSKQPRSSPAALCCGMA